MISVLVVDDSPLVRRLVRSVLDAAPGIRVVGTADDGAHALQRVAELHPDLVTLDVEMPVMDGLAAMRELRRREPLLPVIMVSTLTERSAAATLDALAAGARDYVTKPTNPQSLAQALGELRDQLVPRVHALVPRRAEGGGPHTTPVPPAGPGVPAARLGVFAGPGLPAGPGVPTVGPLPPAEPARPALPAAPAGWRPTRTRCARPPQVVALGSSTGGPDALAHLLRSLPERPAVPFVAVQHMPAVFTAMLARRLDRLGPATVVEAVDSQRLEPGTVYLAPGGRHLEVRRCGAELHTFLHDGRPENYSRPSVDVLFRSVAVAHPGSAIGVVLTGMGHDGRAGCALMASGGSLIVVQDRASSVVWGMPGAVAEAGLADRVMPPERIGPFLSGQLRPGRPTPIGVA